MTHIIFLTKHQVSSCHHQSILSIHIDSVALRQDAAQINECYPAVYYPDGCLSEEATTCF